MVQPYPLPRGIRQTEILVGDDVSATYGPFSFSIFDIEDVVVWTKGADETAFTIASATVSKTSAAVFSPFTVTFDANLPATTEFVVQSRRVAERSSDVTKGIGLDSLALEKELSKQAQTLQELRRDLNTTVRIPFGFLEPLVEAPQDGRALMWELEGLLPRIKNGPTVTEIAAAQSFAERAEAAAALAAGYGNGRLVFDTEDDFETAPEIPAPIAFVEVSGFAFPFDGGGHAKVRIEEPVDPEPWQKQSSDGSWWEIAEDVITPAMLGGSIVDAIAAANALGSEVSFVGTVAAAPSVTTVLRGRSPASSIIERTVGTGPGVTLTEDGAILQGVTLDNKASDGNRAGHGIRTTRDDVTIFDFMVRDFGSMDGLGGGTGVLGLSDGVTRPQRLRIRRGHILGNTGSQITIGWLAESSDYVSADDIIAENIVGSNGIGYAHELKNDSRWSQLRTLTAIFSEVAFAYGQEGVAIGGGAKYNILRGLLGNGVDRGIVSGRTVGNLSLGAIIHADGRPGSSTQSYAVDLQDAYQEAHYAILNFGSGSEARAALLQGSTSFCFVQIANHAEGATSVRLLGTVNNNVIEFSHPGASGSILGTINDTSGAPYSGLGANPVYCHASGEYLGTLSGRFRWYQGNPGASFNAAHRFQMQRDGTAVLAMGTPSAAGNTIGLAHAIPGDGDAALLSHILGINRASDTWNLHGWGSTSGRYVWEQNAYRPGVDNVIALGQTSFRFSQLSAGTATINTSDETHKTRIGSIPDEWLDAWGSVDWVRYKWKDAIAAKGDQARWHLGLIAQEIERVFSAHGIDAFSIGLLCRDPVIETVVEIVEEERQATSEREEEIFEEVIVGDTVVRRKVVQTVEVPLTRMIPVLDENGHPVMEERQTAEFSEEGERITVVEPLMRAVPLMETIQVERQVERETGEWRYGLRYTEAFALEAAWVRRQLIRLNNP